MGRVDANVERFEAIEILRGIEQAVDGFGIGALRFGEAEDGAVGDGHDAGGVGGIVDEFGSFSVEFGVEFAREGFAGKGDLRSVFQFRKFFERFCSKTIEKLRVDVL